ncbi:MAG: hypothetical protein KDJ29_11605, partial [Hyphomicrobiales bacterium]|nr:hypothetical protein [Hyphomicrobiales bacterium]
AIASLRDGNADEARLPMMVDEAAAKSLRGPVAIDAIAPTGNWEGSWMATDRKRREACPWPAQLN